MRLDTRPLMAAMRETGTLSAQDIQALLDELHATRAELARAFVWHEKDQSWAAMNYLVHFMKGEST